MPLVFDHFVKIEERHAALLGLLETFVQNADYDKFLIIDYVCYNPQPSAFVSSDDGLVQTLQFETIEAYCAWANAA